MPESTNTAVEYPLITGAYTAAQAKDCSGNASRSYSGTGYLANAMDAADAESYMAAVIAKHAAIVSANNGGATGIIDALFFDNANDMYGVSPLPCNFSAGAWTSALDTVLSTAQGRVWLNTLSIGTPANQVAGLRSPTVVGGEYEHCYQDGQWATAENLTIETHAAGKAFWCYANGAWSSSSADAVLPQRLFTFASFLLTADPARDVFQEWLATASGFKVMPEVGLVATAPVYGLSTISAAQYTGGAYARTYRACYYRGSFVGQCEVVVNPGSASATVPNAMQYSRSMVLHGSDVYDGGTVTFDGAVPGTLAPKTAAILVR